MCSIFGVIGSGKEQGDLESAFASLAHRGVDSFRVVKSKHWFFGAHRLAIETFGKEQKQPIEKNGYIALFNGEIYNYKELIAEYKFNVADEIELILKLFLKFGKDFVNKLRGMFAIAIYNSVTNELWLFRDLAGKKPLYYSFKDGVFYFASELKAIEAQIGFNLNRRNIHNFLGFGATISPNTLHREIFKLKPNSYLYFDSNSVESEELGRVEGRREKVEGEYDSSLEEVLLDAVNVRVRNLKVNWGILLSGGLDSSLVASMASKVSGQKINCFSIGYEGYEKYDERVYAKEVAEHIGANFYEYNFTKEDFFETINELIEYIDDPIGDPAQIPLFFLIKQAKKEGIKVLLSGDGSDELFLGYRTYKEYHMMEQVKELPYANWLKNHLRANFSMNKEWEWYKRALNKEVIFRSSAEIYTDRQLNMLLRLQERDGKNFEALQEYWNYFKKSGRDIIDWYSYLDLKVQLAEFFLVKVDRVSMANSVEVRSPFLDRAVIKKAFEIKPSIRFTPQNVKSLLKNIAINYLPQNTINRKKKGLNYPFIEWILEENGIEIIYKANKKFNFLNEKHLNYLSSKAKQGKFKQHLFPLYWLSLWLLKR